MKASICDIKRFAVHDGDGIRTTVFFKGCPLKCVWCHNPESIGFAPQLGYYQNKCIGCMECERVCPQQAHLRDGEGHRFDRSRCIACGACESVCLGEALRLYGRQTDLEELLAAVTEDREFYENSGGGVTLSGGECLMQPDFCEQLLKRLKQQGIHTAVDTCGFVSRSVLERVAPYTDLFLYDIKALDEEVHIRCTGQSNRIILENLQYLDTLGKTVEVRIPYVPGYNDDQLDKIADFLRPLNCVRGVKVLGYHNYAGSKYDALGMPDTLPAEMPQDAELCLQQAKFE